MLKKLSGLKLWKKILVAFLLVVVIIAGAFFIYVSDYYRALDYTVSNVNVKEYDGFTVYGDETGEKGFIFYPGGLVETKAYEPLMCELTKEGICCVLVDMPFHLAVLDSDKADKVISELATIDTWYIGGHSLGGAMAAQYASNNSDKIAGLVLLGAYSTSKLPENMRVLSIYGSEDNVINKGNYVKYRDNITVFDEYVIEGGNHGYFGNYGMQDGDGDATITPEEQWNITTEKIVNWMEE